MEDGNENASLFDSNWDKEKEAICLEGLMMNLTVVSTHTSCGPLADRWPMILALALVHRGSFSGFILWPTASWQTAWKPLFHEAKALCVSGLSEDLVLIYLYPERSITVFTSFLKY